MCLFDILFVKYYLGIEEVKVGKEMSSVCRSNETRVE